MCGRYDLNANALELAARFKAAVGDAGGANVVAGAEVTSGAILSVGWRPRYNIAPGQHNPVVVSDGRGHNLLELMRWGLVPAWSRDAKTAYSTINARSETVASKPAFRGPLASQRCLVPATGYFEWVQAAQSAQGSQGKQPYRIQLRGDGLDGMDGIFSFAGLYDIWQGPDGEKLHTYTIVTTRANHALSAIHSRMPVILPGDAEEAWLDPDNKDTGELISLLQPYSPEQMAAYPVSRLVNSPANEGRELIAPLGRLAA